MLIFALDLDSAGLPIPGGATRGQVEAWVHQAPDTRTWVRALIDVMALAQHHGLPTRLLDVTYQSFVAAYFAAADVAEHGRHPGGRLCVWAMDADVLGMGDQMPDEAKIANWCCVVRATRAGNARLIAQDGAFVVWRYPWLSLEQIVATVNPDPYADHLDPSQRYTGPSAVKLTLPNGEASTLLGLLAHERVTGARLFPGPEGVIRYRYERQIHGVHPPDRIYSEPAINLWRKL